MTKLVFGILTAGLIATSVVSANGQSPDVEAPTQLRSAGQTTINGQFNAFRAREHEQAFSFAAPQLQKIFGDTNRFIGMVKQGYSAIYDARQWSFGRSRMKDGALYQEVLLEGPQGKNWKALYTLRKQEDGTWKIGGVRLVPAGTLGT